jgi:hypothetical protein
MSLVLVQCKLGEHPHRTEFDQRRSRSLLRSNSANGDCGDQTALMREKQMNVVSTAVVLMLSSTSDGPERVWIRALMFHLLCEH